MRLRLVGEGVGDELLDVGLAPAAPGADHG